MLGDVIIDGVDIYKQFGVIVQEGGYNALLNYPPLKPFDTVIWPDEDGVEVDLSAPTLNTRNFSIQFAAHGQNQDYAGFLALLFGNGEYGAKGAYHVFHFVEIGVSRTLRFVSGPSFELFQTLRFFTLEFADDFPLLDYSYTSPINSYSITSDGYDIDGVDLSAYSLTVLQGTIAEILKTPAAKKNLLISNAGHGVKYDDMQVVFETKDVKLNCIIRTTTLEDFWRNYNALLFDLIRSGERKLYVDETGEEYSCYYKSCQTQEFTITGSRVWWKFALTLTFTSFRSGVTEYVLAAEDGSVIISEDGGFAIDLK